MPKTERAGDAMQSSVATVSPELSVAELEKFLSEEEISGAPVVDDKGTLVGIVSQTDVLRALSEETSTALSDMLAPDMSVEDIMTPDVLCVPPAASVESVAQKMIDAGVHRALVVDDATLCGIVTSFDLLRVLARRG